MKNTKKGKSALVFGNGPSVNIYSMDELSHFRKRNELEVFCVNNYMTSDLSNAVKPDYCVMGDSRWLNPNIQHYEDEYQNEQLKNRIIENNAKLEEINIPLFIPFSWMNKLKLSNPKIYYNNSSNYYGLYHQNILYPPPLAARTGVYSLWIASFLGYDKIYFLGLDNTLFRLFSVDHMNRLLYGDTHFYSDGGVPGQSSKKSTVAEKLFSYSALFGSMEKIRFGSKAKIYNLDPNGYVDAFEKLSTLNCRLDNL